MLFLKDFWTYIKREGSIFPPLESGQTFITAWAKKALAEVILCDFRGYIIKCNMTSTSLSLYWGTWNPLPTSGGNPVHMGYMWVFQVTANIDCQVHKRISAPNFVSSSWHPDMGAETSHHCYPLTKFLTHRSYKLIHDYCFRPLLFRWFVTDQETANTVVVDTVLSMGQTLSEEASLKWHWTTKKMPSMERPGESQSNALKNLAGQIWGAEVATRPEASQMALELLLPHLNCHDLIVEIQFSLSGIRKISLVTCLQANSSSKFLSKCCF